MATHSECLYITHCLTKVKYSLRYVSVESLNKQSILRDMSSLSQSTKASIQIVIACSTILPF